MSRTFSTKKRIGGELERTGTMRLHRKRLKKPVHRGFGDSARPCGLPNGPVGSRLRSSRQGAFQQRRHLFIFNGAWAAGAQFIVKSRHTPLKETAPPLADRGIGPLQTVRDLAVACAFRRPEHDFGAGDDGMGQVRDRARLESWMRSSLVRISSVFGRPMALPQVTAS